jgi:hypothetical protein
LGPPSLSVSQERYLSTRRTEANGRERRFPVFERLVEAFPEIPEEPNNGSPSPAGTRLAKPRCFSSDNQLFTPNFFSSGPPTRACRIARETARRVD